MTESSEDYELFHYGVKGMKWGVRKSRDPITKSGKIKAARKNLPKIEADLKKAREKYGAGSKQHQKALQNRRDARELAYKMTFGEKAKMTAQIAITADLLLGSPVTRRVIRSGRNYMNNPKTRARMMNMAVKAGTAVYRMRTARGRSHASSFFNSSTIPGTVVPNSGYSSVYRKAIGR